MIDLIAEHLDELHEICREYGVLRLELFGSAARDDFDSTQSDIDLLVVLPDDWDYGPWMGRFLELEDRLAELFGRPVDLVEISTLRNPYLIRSINSNRQLLYAA